jgi:hypothetical protein
MKYQIKTIVNAEDVAADVESEVLDLRYNFGCAIQAKLTGSPSGDVVLQGSNDEGETKEWSEITKDTISGTDTIAFNQSDLMWPYIRIFKAAGGTGTMTVTATIKGA